METWNILKGFMNSERIFYLKANFNNNKGSLAGYWKILIILTEITKPRDKFMLQILKFYNNLNENLIFYPFLSYLPGP